MGRCMVARDGVGEKPNEGFGLWHVKSDMFNVWQAVDRLYGLRLGAEGQNRYWEPGLPSKPILGARTAVENVFLRACKNENIE